MIFWWNFIGRLRNATQEKVKKRQILPAWVYVKNCVSHTILVAHDKLRMSI